MFIFLFVVLLVTLGLALVPARFAAEKGHSFSAWYLFGVALWLPAIIASVWIKDPRLEEVPPAKIKRTDQTVAIISLVAIVPVVLATLAMGTVLFVGKQTQNGFCSTMTELGATKSELRSYGC
jgi:hypothetical protein